MSEFCFSLSTRRREDAEKIHVRANMILTELQEPKDKGMELFELSETEDFEWCIGCVCYYESAKADMNFFVDSLYVLEPDCKGGEEIHTNLRGIPCACPDFEQALEAESNGYTITDGKTSDILALTLSGIGVSCANIPAGYHLPHKDDEYTVLSELTHTLSYVRHLVQILHRRFPHEYKSETQYYAEAELSTK